MNGLKTRGGWYYTVEDDAVSLLGRDGDGLELIIPPFIDGLPVRRIGACAFKEQKITGLSLPSGLYHRGVGFYYIDDIRVWANNIDIGSEE